MTLAAQCRSAGFELWKGTHNRFHFVREFSKTRFGTVLREGSQIDGHARA
jgi:hypothetical protein